jgi:cysteinyl-tRNA synthetase
MTITLAIHLESYNLGSDDELPEHAIFCDTVRHKMYVGAYKEIDYFLLQQHPHEPSQLTAQELEEAVKAVESMTLAFGNVRDVRQHQSPSAPSNRRISAVARPTNHRRIDTAIYPIS